MLRVLEHYTSIQGECDRTGTPTQFVRFAGCNLRCPGWPCDSEFAIEPKQFIKEQRLLPVRGKPLNQGAKENEGLIGNILRQTEETGAHNICLTGGEPMLQPKSDLNDLVKSLSDNWDYTLEMFSNGTLKYSHPVLTTCSIRMDWKLPGSGDDGMGQREANYYNMIDASWAVWHTIKFTIKDTADFEAAMAIYEKYAMDNWPGTIYAGPVWGSNFSAKDIADGILTYQLPWKLNLQVHNYVYGAHTRGT